MKPLVKYKLTLEDESHLTDVTGVRFTLPGLCAAGLLVAVAGLFIAGLLIAFTPLRTLLPGYLKDSQRSATEEGLLRLDSLTAVYDANQAYIDNCLKVLDTDRVPGDSAAVVPVSRELTSDSLMGASPQESRFVSQMEERERFNISVLAPLAAEGVIFSPVAADGIFTSESKEAEEGVVVLTRDESVLSAADGSVIAMYYSAPDGGYVVLVQHNRGFVTCYTHVGSPLVGTGDLVSAGQVLALAPAPDKAGRRTFTVRMWHNGLPIIPYKYIGGDETSADAAPMRYETPRGR